MFRTHERLSLWIMKALTYTCFCHTVSMCTDHLCHTHQGQVTLASSGNTQWDLLPEWEKWGNGNFLALFRLGFLWVFVGAQGDVPKISSNPFSLCLFALHPISAAPGAHRKQGPGSCQKLLVLACLTIPFQKRSLWGSMWDAESAGARGSEQGSPTLKLQPLLPVGYLNKNSSRRENGIFIGHS